MCTLIQSLLHRNPAQIVGPMGAILNIYSLLIDVAGIISALYTEQHKCRTLITLYYSTFSRAQFFHQTPLHRSNHKAISITISTILKTDLRKMPNL